ncbi:related to triacylglycerol lipase V precursor [Phialocephala subalpina]|uniref:Carboxylic ester hydrolase n=1 Tax=Phialocephala subalpina TaxID=576137 RepID=A0A1L7WUE8_9HELO|nr:related to triacylglycerol lipase V precursor [Phialocephala subalpina]
MPSILSVFLVTTCASFVTSFSGAPYTNTTHSASAPTVTIRNGSYTGIYNEQYNQDFFLGIPYAQPPINDLRFRVPRSLNASWNGTRDATAWPTFCVGYGVDDEGHDLSEDCLYLNVFRPHVSSSNSNISTPNSSRSNASNATAKLETGSLPIAVWIHGGGLFMGGTNDQRFNLSFILNTSVSISKPIVAVSIQYRLSAFGFLGGQEVLDEGATNLGFRDQRLALHWVQENIAAFGGDPSKVTIWGESAGAQSVGAHLLAYNGRDDGLFRGAIAQSGGPAVSFFPVGLSNGYNSTAYQSVYNTLVSNTSCSSPSSQFSTSLECLRNLPFSELNSVLNISTSTSGFGPFVPIIDSDFIQTWPSLQLETGNFVKAPLLIGTNTDEGTAFGCSYNVSTDSDFLDTLSSTGIPPDSFAGRVIPYLWPNIEALGIPSPISYPNLFAYDTTLSTMLGSQFRRLTSYFGDIIMHGPRRLTSHTWSRYNTPSWSYRFDVRPNGKTPVIGATHFSEVAFVFNNILGVGYDVNPFGNLTSSEQATFFALADTMSKAWVRFIVDGDPNIGGAAYWPAYNTSVGGGEGWNMVWTVNGTSYVEWDTFRAEAIGWVGDNLREVYGL